MDTASRRSIVAGDRQTDCRAVAEVDRLLYQSLSERTASYHCTSVVVLNCSGKDFAGGSRAFVNQYDQWHFLAATRTVGKFFRTRIFTSLCIYNQFAFGQEFIHHADSSFHISSCIAAKVDNQSFAFLMVELSQSIQQFYMAGTSELADLYITDIIVQHIRGIHSVLRNVSAGDGEVQ